jgi:hypothetical protein
MDLGNSNTVRIPALALIKVGWETEPSKELGIN